MVFAKRYIPETDNIFQELQNIRKKHCISLEKINRETKIPIKYLKALEAGSIESLPDVLYVKNIIKKYLGFFNIDPKPYIVRLEIARREKEAPQKNISAKKMIVIPRLIKTIALCALIIGFISYLGFEFGRIFQPPKINVFYPAPNETVYSNIIEVRGKTEKGVTLFINNEQVVLNKDGEFKKEINLQKGLNIIKIGGVRRYSKENVIWRNVMFEIK
ncbi:MAG: helix-turn-helix domain-containing protein [Patescibacteria group bacterium]